MTIMDTYTIGQLARETHVNVETVRFYERQGLIQQPPRRESGYRQYTENEASRIKFIRRAKDLGFTLKEIKELLSLKTDSENSCDQVRRSAEEKINEIDEKISSLREIRTALVSLSQSCETRMDNQDCPIIEALEDIQVNLPKASAL